MADFITIISTKIASLMGGFFGGAAILTFIKPKTIHEAFLRGSLSTGSAMVFSHPLITILKIDEDWEAQLMAGFCIGFVAYSILGMVANFLKKNQDKDIIETIKEIKR